VSNKTEIEQLIFSILQEKLDKESLLHLGPIEWQQIDQRLLNNPSRLILYSFLKKKDFLDAISTETKKKWDNLYYNNLKRNTLVLGQIKEAQNALREKGAGFILLKGTSLISTVYKDLGIRAFADIDILVKEKDLSILKDAFKQLGYTLMKEEKVGLLEEFGAGELLFRKNGFPHFDVHWNLSFYERFRNIISFDNDKIWSESVRVRFDDTDFTILSPETQILYIAAHLALAHLFWNYKLVGFFDIASLIKSYINHINWDKLIKDATDVRIKVPVYYVLKFTQQLFDVSLPYGVLKRLSPSRLRLKTLRGFVSEDKIFSKDSEYKKTHYFGQTLMMDRLTDIARVGFRGIFPSKEWLMYRYSKNYSLSLRMKHLFKLANLFIKFLYCLTLKRLLDILK